MLKSRTIAVLMGGTSAEREVSLKSGAAVLRAIESLGLNVTGIDADASVAQVLREKNIDLAFIALHGGWGEDGSIQGMLDVMGIPYTGSGVLASAIAMDKVVSKAMFERAGLSVPEYQVVTGIADEISIALPVVIKPSREGSSVGVSIVRDEASRETALREALRHEGPALVERYIKGREVQIGVLGDHALGGVEVRPGNEFYDYEAKYTAGKTQYILPPELDDETYGRAMEAGLAAHRALGCRGGSRVDLLIDETAGIMYVLEVNTIPGMTELSLLPKIARLAGYEFPALIEAMLLDAIKECA